ncbi:MAG: sugar phosphate isomerase/epimerase [Bacteroidales bacterium]
MKHNRRAFIRTGVAFAAGAALLPKPDILGAGIPASDVLGIQLYSIRDAMQADPLGSLKQVAAIGYTNVEHANYVNRKFYGYEAAEFRKILDDLGLRMLFGHTVFGLNHWDTEKKDFTDAWKYTLEDAATCGQQWVISPWMDEKMRNTTDNLKYYMDVFNKCGELCRKSGMKFGYHNHDFEFSTRLDGKQLFDLILQYTDKEFVTLQLDIGNMYHAGGRALEILNKYPGRFDLLHVKDEIKNAQGQYESTILGKGIVQAKEIVDLAKDAKGTSYYIIEQEAYQGMDPMECIREDYKIMRNWGY